MKTSVDPDQSASSEAGRLHQKLADMKLHGFQKYGIKRILDNMYKVCMVLQASR